MHHLPSSMTRRALIVRALGLTAAIAGARFAGDQPHAIAEKKSKKKLTKVQIAQKAQGYADNCTELGGTAVTDAKPGGVSVSCSHSNGEGETCTFHSKGVRCHASAITPGTLPDLQTQHPWSDPGDTPGMPLESTEPALRSARSRRRR